jgi:hypothetical protein
MVWGVAGLQPYFFSSGLILLVGLAQVSWRDLATVVEASLAERSDEDTGRQTSENEEG